MVFGIVEFLKGRPFTGACLTYNVMFINIIRSIPYFIFLTFFLIVQTAFGGERASVADEHLINKSSFIFAGEVLSIVDSNEMLDGKACRNAKIWISEVLKGNINPSFTEPRRR